MNQVAQRAPRAITVADRIAELVQIFGSMQQAALGLDIDCGYLCRLASGAKTNPSDAVLARLGLERVVLYRPLTRVYEATPLTPRTKSA